MRSLDLDADNIPDITWLGSDLRRPDWDDPELRTICYRLDGGEEPSAMGKYLLLLILNADYNLRPVQLPVLSGGRQWRRVIDTSLPADEDFCEAGREVPLDPAD